MKTYRKRYIAFEVKNLGRIYDSRSSLARAILWKLSREPYQNDSSSFRFRIIEYSQEHSRGIVSVSPHFAVASMEKIIQSIDEIQGLPVEVRILGAGGTLRATRRKYMVQSGLKHTARRVSEAD